MDVFARNHIHDLSDEVLLKIIVHLNSLGTGSDLINLSLTSTRLNSLTEDKKVVSSLSFRRDFGISPENLKHFFSSSLRCGNISHLNLNSCYFISSTLIRSILVKLKNLQSLHVADTSITASSLVSVIMENPLLVNLSFSWWWSAKDAKAIMEPHLQPFFGRFKSLTVHVNSRHYCPLDQLACILEKCVNLERLVIFSDIILSDIATMPGRYNLNVQFPVKMRFPQLKEYICKLHNETYPFLIKREFFMKMRNGIFPSETLEVYWDELGRSYSSLESVLHKISNTPQLKTLYSEAEVSEVMSDEQKEAFIKKLENLTFLRYGDPSTNLNCLSRVLKSNSFKKLAVIKVNISKLWGDFIHVEKLEELSISKPLEEHALCNSGLRNIGQIGFKNLKKLRVPICLIRSYDESIAEKRKENTKKAKGRVSRAPSLLKTTSSIFSDLAENVGSTLEHLELHKCLSFDKMHPKNHIKYCGEEVLEQLEKLPKLKVLVLSQIQINVGKSKNIFPKIFQSCSLLEELKIHSLRPHGNSQGMKTLFKDLSDGLSQAANLKSLSIEQQGLVESFNGILQPAIRKCVKLQKLVLVDPGQSFLINKFDISGVKDIISQNVDLTFFYARCNIFTNDNIKKLKAQYKKTKQAKPHLICHFQRQLEDEKNIIGVNDLKDIPAMYINDLLPVSPEYGNFRNYWSTIANITFNDVF